MKKEQYMLVNAAALKAAPQIIEFSAIFAGLSNGLASVMVDFASAIAGKALDVTKPLDDFFSPDLQGLVSDVLEQINANGDAMCRDYYALLEEKIAAGALDEAFVAARQIEVIIPHLNLSAPLSASELLALVSLKESEYAPILAQFELGFASLLTVIQQDLDALEAQKESLSQNKKDQFINALKENDVEKLEQLIAAGENINQGINTRDKPISVAAAHNSADVVEFLINNGAHPHASFPENSALKIAIEHHFLAVIRVILTHSRERLSYLKWNELLPWELSDEHVDLVALFFEFELALDIDKLAEKACQKNHCKLLALYLANGLDPNKAQGSSNLGIIAVEENHQELLSLLIEKGLDVNSKDFFESSLLVLAIDKEAQESVKLLIDKSAKIFCSSHHQVAFKLKKLAGLLDISFQDALKSNLFDVQFVDNRGENFLHYAVEEESFECADLGILIDDLQMDVNRVTTYNKNTVLTLTNDSKKLRYLIDKGADVNCVVDDKPVVFSVDKSAIPLLIEAGADVNTSFNGEPLLHQTIAFKSPLLGLLLEKGVDVRSKNKQDETALEWNIHYVDYLTPYMPALIAAGADLNKTTREDVPLITAICCLYDVDIISCAIEAGWSVNRSDGNRNSVVMHASIAGNVDAIPLLVAAGAGVNDENRLGVTPLMHAVYEANLPLVTVLLEHGADASMKLAGRDALALATELGHLHLMPLLQQQGILT